MTDTLDAASAAAAWGTLAPASAPVAGKPKVYHHYKPLADAATAFIREAQDKDRVFTGIQRFDDEMRGIGRGHLCGIVGYSHSGKTQLLLRILRHNKGKRIAFFIPDEPQPLVLSKLASIESGIPARELEFRVGDGDADAIRVLRDTAMRDFPNLAVFDKPITPSYLNDGLAEVRDVWGEKEDLVIVDYVDLVQAGETVPAKFDFLKAVVANESTRMIAIHQTSRSAGADGKKMTISSGNYGGEQHLTFMIGVRRKKSGLQAELEEQREKANNGNEKAMQRIPEIERELRIHQYTITANLVKNKRPGGGLVDDLDLEIDKDTGRLYDIEEGDLPNQYHLDLQAAKAQRQVADTPTTDPSWSQHQLDYDDEEPF